MNINHPEMWPSTLPGVLQVPSVEAIKQLVDLRRKTYQGFAQIEEKKGVLAPEMSLRGPMGQEASRILIQRGLEELVEAVDSNETDHYLEELIDSLNYFWSLMIIDPASPLDLVIIDILNILPKPSDGYAAILREKIDAEDLGLVLLTLGPVFEALRNRSWMNNPQSHYFEGWPALSAALSKITYRIFCAFDNWEHFVKFYIAKNNVLQFRLSTNY